MQEEYEGIRGEEKGNADYGRMVQPSQQHVESWVKGVEWILVTRALRRLKACQIFSCEKSKSMFFMKKCPGLMGLNET